MHIEKRSAVAIYRLVIVILAVIGLWIELASFQESAWRLFATWTLAILAIYYMVVTIKTAFWKRSAFDVLPCPMLQGMLLVAGVSMLIASVSGLQLTGLTGFSNVLIAFLIPLLLLGDYFIFSKKGSWRTIEPFYWLAFPVVYVASIIITGDFMYTTDPGLVYPYGFLNFHAIGVDRMLWFFALEIAVVLVVGYILVVIDRLASGKVAQHIVMPRIKTIVIEEEVSDTVQMPEKSVGKVKQMKSTTQKKPQAMQVTTQTKKSLAKLQDVKPVSNKTGSSKTNAKPASTPKRARNADVKKSPSKPNEVSKPNKSNKPAQKT